MKKTFVHLSLLGILLANAGCEQAKKDLFDKQLVEAANEVNKTCPITVDAETRLDNAAALPNKTFQYNYTLINVVKDSLDTAYLQDFLKPKAIATMKTNPALKSFKDNQVTMCYVYNDKNANYICKIKISPEDYK